jgi:integrase
VPRPRKDDAHPFTWIDNPRAPGVAWILVRVAEGPQKGRRIRRSTGVAAADRAAATRAAYHLYESILADVAAEDRAAADAAARGPEVPAEEGVIADLALLAGYDYARAAADGVGKRQMNQLERFWEKHLFRLLGVGLPIAEITYSTVIAYLTARRAEGARGQSLRKEIGCLKRTLKVAVREGLIPVVPELPERIKTDPARSWQRGKLHPLPVLVAWLDEVKRREAEDSRSAGAWLQARVSLQMGLRGESEAQQLAASWLEEVPASVTRASGAVGAVRVPASAAKDREERLVGIDAEMWSLLAAEAEGKPWDAPLLPGRHDKIYRAASVAIGYKRPITLRDLRHCYASYAAEEVDLVAVQSALGHADLEVTQRYLTTTFARTAKASVVVAGALARERRGLATPNGHTGGGRSRKFRKKVSGRQDSNLRPSAPKAALLPGSALQSHLETCESCRRLVEQCIGLRVVEGGLGHTNDHTEGEEPHPAKVSS